MPRTARLDAPGVLHHVMIRGIERRKIFRNDEDRKDFIKRLEVLCPETQTSCYGWAFMSNHAHFLFCTGRASLFRLMRRLLTGYVIGFNRRQNRCGQLSHNLKNNMNGGINLKGRALIWIVLREGLLKS